jgi:hypothetical protein
MTPCLTAFRKCCVDALGPALVALLFACPLALQPRSAQAETRISGGPETVRVEAREASLDEVLGALAGKFQIQYRASVPLDRTISGTFSGSLSRVVARLLDGYDRVVKRDGSGLEIVILGVAAKSSSPGEQSPVVMAPLPNLRPRTVPGTVPGTSVHQTLTAMASAQVPGAPPPSGKAQPAGTPTPGDIADLTRTANAKLQNLRNALGRLPH